MKYKCRFEFIKSSTSGAEQLAVESYSSGCFIGGFWINDKLKLTKSLDKRYFIPASQIYLIEKMPV